MATNAAIRQALARGQTIDIMTTGRRGGQQRRIETVSRTIDRRLSISGGPGPRKRDWIANREADPRLIFHLKETGAN